MKKEDKTIETFITQRKQIADLDKGPKIYISMRDLIQEVSAITNIPKDELDIELKYMRNTFSKFPKYHLLEVYKDIPVTLMLKIYDSCGNILVDTSFDISFNDKTSDGQTLIDHSWTSYIDSIDLMTLEVIEEYIPTVMFKINFKNLIEKDSLENQAIINCLKKQKYMTEEEVKNLTSPKENSEIPEDCQFTRTEDGKKVLVMTLNRPKINF